MSEFSNHADIEARLSAYGDVLRSNIEEATQSGATIAPIAGADVSVPARSGSNVVFGRFGSGAGSRRSTLSVAAMLSAVAAVIAVVALILPTVIGPDSSDPVMVNGGVASEGQIGPEGNEGASVDQTDADSSDPDTTEDDAARATSDEAETPAGEAEEGPNDADWSEYAVRVDDSSSEPGQSVKDPDALAPEGGTQGSAALATGDGEPEKEPGTDGGDGEPEKEPGADSESGTTDPADDEDCPAGSQDRDGTCVVVGAPPTAEGDCPDGAVELGNECYKVVPPSCGELAVAADGSGCLQPVGAAGSGGPCPEAYKLEGDTCVKLLAAKVTCSEGVPSSGSCLVKEPAVGGQSGCAVGLLQVGGDCYELTDPTTNCGSLATLADGNCRYPVEPETGGGCPDGFDPLGDRCFRYEEPPTITCPEGTTNAGQSCYSYVDATPGPDACGEGVLEDAQGCYILVAPDGDGSCGSRVEQDGMCRKDKPASPTWTCADGSEANGDQCKIWTEATVACATGELAGDKCKSFVDQIGTTSCPSYAQEDAQGCYKVKEPTMSCGDLAVAPDGKHCKNWVGSATSDGASCEPGFELHGDYCKKYVDGEASCDGAELVYDGGKAWCRYTQPAGAGTAGCDAGLLEQDGKCYNVTAPSCGDLDLDVYGTGCKQPVDGSDPSCEAGYELVGAECLKKLA